MHQNELQAREKMSGRRKRRNKSRKNKIRIILSEAQSTKLKFNEEVPFFEDKIYEEFIQKDKKKKVKKNGKDKGKRKKLEELRDYEVPGYEPREKSLDEELEKEERRRQREKNKKKRKSKKHDLLQEEYDGDVVVKEKPVRNKTRRKRRHKKRLSARKKLTKNDKNKIGKKD